MGMRPSSPLIASALAAATLALGAGTAAAQESKPITREAPKEAAVDAQAAAAAARFEEEGSSLGSYWDPERRELVVVVGPDGNIGEAEAEKLAEGPVRLEKLAIAKKEADAIREQIAAREFGEGAEKYSYSSHLDLQTGKVVVRTDAPPEVTAALVKEHPEQIVLEDSKPVEDLFHRRDDIPSFCGGAAITSGGTCSAGFTVRKPSGERFMTTAAHCFAVGATVRTPTGRLFGTVRQRGTLNHWWFFANRDVELIGGQSYAARVYTGGVTSTSSKAVVGAGDPVAGFTGYCTSGQTTGEQCNQTVQSTSALVCTQSGCKWPVIEYTGGPSQGGDSGGPMYLPSGSTQVFARGSVIAGNGTTSFAEPWSRMSSAMGVSIAL